MGLKADATADQIREYYKQHTPKGYFKDEFDTMSEDELLDFHYFRCETVEEVFLKPYGIPISDAKKHKKRG